MLQMERRQFLRLAAAAGMAGLFPNRSARADVPATQPPRWRRQLVRFPQKTDLILLTDSPPQLETPIEYFRKDLTPNEAFFVRWHYAAIPTSVDTRAFRLAVGGHVDSSLSLSLDDLKSQFEPVSLIAVAQCSGNSRGFFEPRVLGGQWGNGAMGNAKWTGVRLRDLLERTKIRTGAVDVSFAGLDRTPMPDMPPYVKSLAADHAMDGEVMVAYAMNDRPLPMLNGFPLRLVVPGWFATYWIKALSDITVLPKAFSGFWMDKAYRIPKNEQGQESPTALATETVPINRHTVRSIFVWPLDHERIRSGSEVELQGLALDGGHGIRRVEVSVDGARTWSDARLDEDLGRYSWRRWRYTWRAGAAGSVRLMCRATNSRGDGQVQELWNRSGYQRNVVEQVQVTVV
jgi:DMSO/TMAO reductase YedYZ molybdopterin-dependent catalytic subunit